MAFPICLFCNGELILQLFIGSMADFPEVSVSIHLAVGQKMWAGLNSKGNLLGHITNSLKLRQASDMI